MERTRVERFIRSDATTMKFLGESTSIRIPEIFEFDDNTRKRN